LKLYKWTLRLGEERCEVTGSEEYKLPTMVDKWEIRNHVVY